MNPIQVSDLLERAAATVTPEERDPASRMVSLGRRSVRRRRAWTATGAVVAALAAVVAVPLVSAVQDRMVTPATTVSFDGLTVAVPKGWRTRSVELFDPCRAEPRTLYLAPRWDLGYGARPSSGPGRGTTVTCSAEGQAWMAVVHDGIGQYVNPPQVVVRGDRLLQAAQPDEHTFPSLWGYRAVDEFETPTAFISGDEQGRASLLRRITWPAGPAAPPAGGLALPDRITSATSEAPPSNGMVVATDARTLTRIRAKLAELREPVPAGADCTLQLPGSVGINLGEITVVLGDATCPQAISTGGGRVLAPAGLGQELLTLIVESDRAASERGTKD